MVRNASYHTAAHCDFKQEFTETIAGQLHNWEINPFGTEGYEKAEVTGAAWTRTNIIQDNGDEKGTGLIFCGRSGGCNRLAGRL